MLNQPQYADASILVAGPDFGTGSSREHAVLGAAGRRLPGGHQLPVRRHLPQQLDQGRAAHRRCCRRPTSRRCGRRSRPTRRTPVTVDLQAKQVTYGDVTVPFEIDDYTRWRLLEGLDDVGLTERNLPDIEAFEAHPAVVPAEGPARRLGRAPERPGRGRGRGSSPRAAPRAGRPAPRRCPWRDGGHSRRSPVRRARPGPSAPTGSRRPGCRRRSRPGVGPGREQALDQRRARPPGRRRTPPRRARAAARPSSPSALGERLHGLPAAHAAAPRAPPSGRTAAAPRPAAGLRAGPRPSSGRRSSGPSQSDAVAGPAVPDEEQRGHRAGRRCAARSASTSRSCSWRAQRRGRVGDRQPAQLVDLVVGLEVAAERPASPSSRPAWRPRAPG